MPVVGDMNMSLTKFTVVVIYWDTVEIIKSTYDIGCCIHYFCRTNVGGLYRNLYSQLN